MDSEKGERKKILFVITKGNWGGAQKYVYDLATSLPTTDYEVTVAYGEGDKLASQLSLAGISSIKLPRSRRDITLLTDLALFFDLLKLYHKVKPDIIHLNSSKIGGLGALAGRFYNFLRWFSSLLHTTYHIQPTRVIFTVHGWAFNEERSDWQKTLIALAHWFTVILTHQTICLARREYDQMAPWLIGKNKLVIIHNGVEQIPRLEKSVARDELINITSLRGRINPDSYWIGTIAELHKNKGLDFLLEAANQLKNKNLPLQILIIGGGEEEENLRQLIAKYELSEVIYLLGPITNARYYLPAFDLFVLPSRKEGLPFALLEAGQAGLPVIASRVGGIPEIVTDDTGILIGLGNIKELTLAIEKMSSDPTFAQHLAQNLQTKIKRDFSLQQMVEKTVALYKNNQA